MNEVLVKVWINILGVLFISCLIGLIFFMCFYAKSELDNRKNQINYQHSAKVENLVSNNEIHENLDLEILIKDELKIQAEIAEVSYNESYEKYLVKQVVLYIKSNMESPQTNANLIQKLKGFVKSYVKMGKKYAHSLAPNEPITLDRSCFLQICDPSKRIMYGR